MRTLENKFTTFTFQTRESLAKTIFVKSHVHVNSMRGSNFPRIAHKNFMKHVNSIYPPSPCRSKKNRCSPKVDRGIFYGKSFLFRLQAVSVVSEDSTASGWLRSSAWKTKNVLRYKLGNDPANSRQYYEFGEFWSWSHKRKFQSCFSSAIS